MPETPSVSAEEILELQQYANRKFRFTPMDAHSSACLGRLLAAYRADRAKLCDSHELLRADLAAKDAEIVRLRAELIDAYIQRDAAKDAARIAKEDGAIHVARTEQAEAALAAMTARAEAAVVDAVSAEGEACGRAGGV